MRLKSFAVIAGVWVCLMYEVLPAAEPPGEGKAAAAKAVNALGVDLLRHGSSLGGNVLLSPYSIQTALAMTYAGSSGKTKDEMARVLHYPGDELGLHRSFASLQLALDSIVKRSDEFSQMLTKHGGVADHLTLASANSLFGQRDFHFEHAFLSLLNDSYKAPFQPVDFVKQAPQATVQINRWVEQHTQQKIRDLIPPDMLNASTRLVLANAIYFKAPWSSEFDQSATQPRAFHINGAGEQLVPTMHKEASFRYVQQPGFKVVVIPYLGSELQFLVLLPDAVNGLADFEKRLTPELLASFATPPSAELIFELPKFKLQPPAMSLGAALKTLGLRTAFDDPRGSANFERMAPRTPNDYLFISEVLHKTFIAVDEKGTEAAAATAVVMASPTAALKKPTPIEVKVDHPFLFAIQHRESGACLFLGRIVAPVWQ
jgi:serpin B